MAELEQQKSGWSRVASTLSILLPGLSSAKTWDREYARGDWRELHSHEELGRYAVILGHLLRLPRAPAVLDVGCGSGRLLQFLARVEFGSYLGVDLSAEAVQRARELGVPRSAFEVGHAESFRTEQRFDAIVFNEVAYYLRRPAEVALRSQAWLRPGGALIVSMYRSLPARWVWRQLAAPFETVSATRVINADKHAWDVRVLRAR